MSIAACSPTPPAHGVVVFEPTVFKTQFPEFATVSDAALGFNFTRATLQLTNTCGSRVTNAALRELLLTLLTAHITALNNGVNGATPAGLVGRVNSASQGSVSASADYASNTPQGMAWYTQTSYGAEYWAATATYRTAVYIRAAADCNAYVPYSNGPYYT